MGSFVAAALVLAAVYAPTIAWLTGRWGSDPFYSHGPLVPLISAWVLWNRRERLRLDPAVRGPALGLLAGAALLLLLGGRLKFEFLSSISILLSLAALLQLAGGAALLREAAFPLAYALFALPLPMLLLEKISLPLQVLSSACAGGFLGGLGVEVTRRGVLLVFPGFTLAVADACSGLRSLITVLALSTLAAHLMKAPAARKLLLVGAGMLAALAANVLRIALSGLVGLVADGDAAVAFFEGWSGLLFFALVILGLLGGSALLEKPAPAVPKPAAPAAAAARPLAAVLLAPLLLILAPAGAAAAWLRADGTGAAPERLASWRPSLPGWELTEAVRREGQPGEELLRGLLRRPGGAQVSFSAVYGVSGRYLHSPEACSLAAGWIAERQELIEAGGLPVNVWILRRGAERVCLFFWYSLAGAPQRSTLGQHVGAVWQRLRTGRIDSAYGELSLPLPLGREAPVAELLPVAAALQKSLQEFLWPR